MEVVGDILVCGSWSVVVEVRETVTATCSKVYAVVIALSVDEVDVVRGVLGMFILESRVDVGCGEVMSVVETSNGFCVGLPAMKL